MSVEMKWLGTLLDLGKSCDFIQPDMATWVDVLSPYESCTVFYYCARLHGTAM
jgi:hypothetical protein